MQPMIRSSLFAIAAASITACVNVTKPPAAHASLAAGNLYAFRGVPQARNGVVQGDMGFSVTDDDVGTFAMTAWGNMNLSDDSGAAIFPDGNGGKFTEIDLVPEFSRTFDKFTGAIGAVNYNFPNGVGTSTTEVYVSGALDTLFSPKLTIYYDVEEVKGLYAQASIGHEWKLCEKLSAKAGLSLAFATARDGQAYWLDKSSGLADLVASAGLAYEVTPHMSMTATGSASTIVAHGYRDALDNAGIEPDSLWFLVGAAWSF
jgi:hypothetical protein